MNRKAILIVLAIMVLAVLVTPVSAIGPWQASEASDNDNFFVLYGGIGSLRGEASGSNVWAQAQNKDTGVVFSVQWKWRNPADAEGIMNNALVPTTLTELATYVSRDYQNKWVFLSGKPATGHGTLYYFWYYFTQSSAIATAMENTYPNGMLWMNNFIDNNVR